MDANPDSVKAQTGHILEVANCLVLWISISQPMIAACTVESEHAALSAALCAAIPLLDLAKVIAKGLVFSNNGKLTFVTAVHEDNQGSLKLANSEEGRNNPRSKVLCSPIAFVQVLVASSVWRYQYEICRYKNSESRHPKKVTLDFSIQNESKAFNGLVSESIKRRGNIERFVRRFE